jgi:hypothetical protein
MDSKELRNDFIDIGGRVLAGLDDSDINVSSAFWFLLPDSGWRLVIATSIFDEVGANGAYETLLKKVAGILGGDNAFINSISIVSPSHPLVQLLRSAINTGPDSNSGIRFKGNIINGQLIEDAYIYRVS